VVKHLRLVTGMGTMESSVNVYVSVLVDSRMCLLLIASLSGMSKPVVLQQLPQVKTTFKTQM